MHALSHVTRSVGQVGPEERRVRNDHRGAVVWLTGLSGSGKSTLANALERELFDRGLQVFVLDGDNIRCGLSSDLGFSAGDRARARRIMEEGVAIRFFEVFLDAPLEVCEQRDQKGLYDKARSGEITDFTGVSAPYERPEHLDLVLDTGECSIQQGAAAVLTHILPKVVDSE